ncbi:MAG: SPFH domain-containing protein [Clostridia bacterium]|nr:SPFH domain-containing protein [Clostridia bacterium]
MENNRIVPAVPAEKTAPHKNGFFSLAVNLIGMIAAVCCLIFGCIRLANSFYLYSGILLTVGIVGVTAFSILFAGFKVLAPNQAYVFTLFGKYYGTIKEPGFYHLNPFVTANAPAVITMVNGQPAKPAAPAQSGAQLPISTSKKISLKTRTLDNRTQKVNDAMGNPIIIGSVVIWRVSDPTAAVFAVENFEEYLSIQCDSTIRNIARLYPYDTMEDDADEKTLRGSSSEVSEIMQQELAARVKDAGIVIEDVRITTLAYSDEIAAAMLQRQQATAIIAARQKIVEGAVGMVKMAIDQLGQEEVVVLDEERKAAMVSNLLVVLCGNKDAQPVVNSSSIY